MTTTQEIVSSCISYANSTKAAVGFAVMASSGDSLRDEIRAGKYEGVSFPDEDKPRKARDRGTTEEHRINTVELIHKMRGEGQKAREAAELNGICYETYTRWRDELKMPYKGACLRGKNKKSRRSSHTITQAYKERAESNRGNRAINESCANFHQHQIKN